MAGVEGRVGQADLGQLDAPVAVLVPDRLIQDAGPLPERVLAERGVDVGHGGRRAREDPALRGPEAGGDRILALGADGDRVRSCPDDESRRVPELVREVAGVLKLFLAKLQIVARRGSVDE